MYVKIVEQRLLDAIIQFLDEHDVDVSDLVERQTTILNNGVMLSGGSIQAENLAVGRGATATNAVEAAGRTLADRGQTELADRLAELVRQLEAHASRLDNADELRETTEAVAAELAKQKPNRITVTGLLDGLARGVGSVAGLTTAVQALAQAAIAIL